MCSAGRMSWRLSQGAPRTRGRLARMTSILTTGASRGTGTPPRERRWRRRTRPPLGLERCAGRERCARPSSCGLGAFGHFASRERNPAPRTSRKPRLAPEPVRAAISARVARASGHSSRAEKPRPEGRSRPVARHAAVRRRRALHRRPVDLHGLIEWLPLTAAEFAQAVLAGDVLMIEMGGAAVGLDFAD
jgi:hypothetical protein